MVSIFSGVIHSQPQFFLRRRRTDHAHVFLGEDETHKTTSFGYRVTHLTSMKPTLWGPPLWQAMFSCAWTCEDQSIHILREMLLEQIPLLLPCPQCRQHFVDNLSKVNRRAKSKLETPEEAFRWLWFLKDEVNKTLNRRSTSLPDITERHRLHQGVVDDVALADVLVLVAINAVKLHRVELFVSFCDSLVTLLPLPSDSQFLEVLEKIAGSRASCSSHSTSRNNVVASVVRAARAARVERGLNAFSMLHYQSVVDK